MEDKEEMQSPKTATSLSQEDRATLDLAKVNRQMAKLTAEKAASDYNTAEMSFKYLVLQLYMKYGLTEQDGIDEQGGLIRSEQ